MDPPCYRHRIFMKVCTFKTKQCYDKASLILLFVYLDSFSSSLCHRLSFSVFATQNSLVFIESCASSSVTLRLVLRTNNSWSQFLLRKILLRRLTSFTATFFSSSLCHRLSFSVFATQNSLVVRLMVPRFFFEKNARGQALGLLVPVSYIHYCTYTSGLSTM